jgi:hypothetical protein
MPDRDAKGRFPRGNGAGKGQWGGPAKGASTSRLAPAGDDYSDAIRALARDPAHAESKAPLRELVFRTWVDVATASDNDSARVAAAEKIADRLDGKAVQRQDIKLRNVNPDEMTDEELAAIAAGRSGAASGASGD